jgi:hypothetical protein
VKRSVATPECISHAEIYEWQIAALLATAQVEGATRPEPAVHTVDPKRALGYLDDLRSLWDVELPESPEHQDIRREYELRRAQATAAGFERLEVLGPVIVEAKGSADPMAGASLALSSQPERAELIGPQADVVRTLIDGHHSRLAHTDTPEARKKRRHRTETGTLRCFGRGERLSPYTNDLLGTVRVAARAPVSKPASVA